MTHYKHIKEQADQDTTTFITQLGSEAFARVYDLLHLYDDVRDTGLYFTKDDPSEVRALKDKRLKTMGDALELIEDALVGWLEAVAKQERGLHDVFSLNKRYDNKLEERGIIDRVIKHLYEHTTIMEQYEPQDDLEQSS